MPGSSSGQMVGAGLGALGGHMLLPGVGGYVGGAVGGALLGRIPGLNSMLGALNPLGGLFGSDDASEALQQAQLQQRQALLEGMGRAEGAMGQGYQQGMSALSPWEGTGRMAQSAYMQRLLGGSGDADIQRQLGQDISTANQQGAMRGLVGSKWSSNAIGTAIGNAQMEREKRFYERAAPMIGYGANAAAQMGNLGMQYGQGLASMYGNAYGGLASSYGQSGMAQAQAAMAPMQNAIGLAGAAAPAFGAYYGAQGGAGAGRPAGAGGSG